jgi:hypothetical protein
MTRHMHMLLVDCMGVCVCLSADEIGDTWVFGLQSDPLKTANFRALSRLRAACLQQPSCPSDVSNDVGTSEVRPPAVLHISDG